MPDRVGAPPCTVCWPRAHSLGIPHATHHRPPRPDPDAGGHLHPLIKGFAEGLHFLVIFALIDQNHGQADECDLSNVVHTVFGQPLQDLDRILRASEGACQAMARSVMASNQAQPSCPLLPSHPDQPQLFEPERGAWRGTSTLRFVPAHAIPIAIATP